MANQRKDYLGVACALLGFFGILSGAQAANVTVQFDWSSGFAAKDSAGATLSTVSGTSLQLGWFDSVPTNWSLVNRSNLSASFTSLGELSYSGPGGYTFDGDYTALDVDPTALNRAFLVITSGSSELGIFAWAKAGGSDFYLPRDPDVAPADVNAVNTIYGDPRPYMYNMTALVGSVSSGGVQLASASGAVTSPQSITFGSIPSKSVGDSFALAATATSGLPVSYSSSNPSVATVAGDVVTINAAGFVEIIASVAGNSSFAPATVSQPVTAYASTTLRVASLGTPVLNAGQTSVIHTFIGNPNATYTIEYKTDLSAATWSTITVQTGASGTFPATFTSSGDYVNAWKNRMFFRAKNS